MTLGQGMKKWDGKLMHLVLEEACLIVANDSGKQRGLRMAYSCGNLSHVPCQGHCRGWASCHIA